jgi:hypothetical protein
LEEGDHAITYVADDILAGDLVAFEAADGKLVRRYRPAPGGYMTFETVCDQSEPLPYGWQHVATYKPGEVKIVGRVVHVERKGAIVLRLRPIREEAHGGGASADPKTAARTEQLREQIRRLLDEGEAHNESGVYRLRRELYELENGGSLDEWPGWIPG